MEVEVDEFGFLVIAQDWNVDPGKQNLITALKEAISASKDGMRLVVKVHEMAKLRSLVDAMDAGTIAGFAELEVTQATNSIRCSAKTVSRNINHSEARPPDSVFKNTD